LARGSSGYCTFCTLCYVKSSLFGNIM
jgi:hypothetical protein